MTSRETVIYDLSATDAPATFRFVRCSREPLSWVEELKSSAKAIASSTKKPIWIASSGGIDSEVVCEIFFNLGISFKVLTVAYSKGENAHDIAYAKAWCDEHRIEQRIHELDFEEFLNGEMRELVEAGYIGRRPFRYMQIKYLSLIEELGGYGILGGGEQLYEIAHTNEESDKADPFLAMETGYTCPLEWCRRNGVEHEPYFYFSRPEILLAWMREPTINFMLHNPYLLKHPSNMYAIKAIVIRSYFPSQKWRLKYHGYEKLSDFVQRTEAFTQTYFARRLGYFQIKSEDIRRQLEPQPNAR